MANTHTLDLGDSFEIQDANGRHLHFIIAEASNGDHDSVILVYLSSSKTRYKDTTTIIKYGEHPYITKIEDESWIRYQNSILCSRDDIVPLITTHYGKISQTLLKRIQAGFENSPRVEKGLKNLYFQWKMDRLYKAMK